MTTGRHNGACLCGAVRVSTTLTGEAQACHCQQCQTWTGGGPYYVVRGDGFQFSGEENIARFRSSDWAERAFCKTCGATLFWHMTGHEIRGVAAGLFAGRPESGDLTIGREIFVDARPGWMPVTDAPEQWTEAEVAAHFGFAPKGDA